MRMKKVLSALAAGLMLFSMTACASGGETKKEATAVASNPSTAPKKMYKFGMITDTGGVHDQSFNQSAWEGLEKLKKEHPDNVEISYLESSTDADYPKNIEAMIDRGNDIIIGIGFKMAPVIVEAAKNYPEQKFAIVDGTGEDKEGKIPANVQGIIFKANQTAFLGGYIAGRMSKTLKVGHMNALNSPTMNEFAAGYYAGVWTANPKIEIFGQYANSFSDVAKGHSIADQMYSQGCDIVYAAGGDTGNGVIDAAKEKNKWVIGVDRDQYSLAPENMLTSTMKRVDAGLFTMCEEYMKGNPFGGKPVVYGLSSGAVGLSPSTQHIPKDILEDEKKIEAKILSGEIKVPSTEEELIAMFPEAPSKFMK